MPMFYSMMRFLSTNADRRQTAKLQPILAGAVLSLISPSVLGMQQKDTRDGGAITRPAFSGRITRAFDFEEMYSNPLPVPRGWIRAQHDPDVPRDRPGFPIWNGAVLDYESPAYSGQGSVFLPTKGGSTSLILRHGELTVFPNADYMISARVRTQGLLHARARMVATLIDRAGNDIVGSQVSTKLVRTRGEWDLINVFVEGTEPSAAFVRVELELLQPEQQPRLRKPKPFTVWEQDFEGGVWFDDVVVAQVPMIGLDTGAAGNVVSGDVPPVLNMSVRDLTGDDLRSYIRVFDSSGALVDQRGASGGAEKLGESWTPKLNGYGWYHAVFDVISGEGESSALVGRGELAFVWQPEKTRGELVGGFGAKRMVPEDSLFVLRTTSMEPNLLRCLPDLADSIGVKRVEMRVWDGDTVVEDLRKGSVLLSSIDRAIGMGMELSLSLSEVPWELADQAAIDQDAIFKLLLEHEPIAMPLLGPLMDRYGQQVSDWRLGNGVNENDGERLVGEIDEIATLVDPYIPGAVLGVGWAMDRPFEPGVLGSSMRLMVEDDPSFPDDAIPDMIEQWSQARGSDGGAGSSRLSVVHRAYEIEEGRTGNESVWSRVGWLGRRAINSWWASKLMSPGNDEMEIVLSDPWIVEKGQRGRVMPGPELLVWRTLVDYLGGRSALEELSFEPGVRMLLCSGIGDDTGVSDGALVVWLDEPMLEETVVKLPMSRGAIDVVDLFGNVSTVGLEYETELNLPVHRVKVTRTPQIITGVNTKMVQFLSSIRLSPDRFEATTGVHLHELVMKNPWPFSIRGRVYIVEPGGYSVPGSSNVDRSWEIKPRVVNFTITGGLEERVPLDVSYSSANLSGMKDLVFDVELAADEDYGLMRVEREIELGTDVIELDLRFQHVEGESGSGSGAVRRRVEVVAMVSNQTEDPMYADVVAIAPKNARQESSISSIEGMGSGERSFVFERLVSGDEVVIRVQIPGRNIQLNKAITLP
jgi:hypothetical protein